MVKHIWRALKIQPIHVGDNNSWEVINDDNDIIATNLTEVNARLIASAPEMFVLLQKARLSLAYNNAHSAVKTGDDIEALLTEIKEQSNVEEEDNGIECSDCHEKFDSESELFDGVCQSCDERFKNDEQTTGDK